MYVCRRAGHLHLCAVKAGVSSVLPEVLRVNPLSSSVGVGNVSVMDASVSGVGIASTGVGGTRGSILDVFERGRGFMGGDGRTTATVAHVPRQPHAHQSHEHPSRREPRAIL